MGDTMLRKRVLSVIIGSNGAGKTTLAKKIMGEKRVTGNCDFGKYTLCINNNIINNSNNNYNIIAIGSYSNTCGGVDTVKYLKNAYKMVVDLAKSYSGVDLLMDSFIMSGLFTSPVKMYLELKYQYGFDVEICLLYASERESVRRVYQRNGGTPVNTGLILAKRKQAMNVYKKLLSLGEFRCAVIDTTGKSPEGVFNAFKNWSSLYKK